MNKSCECRSCGNIIYVTDKKCPYCGSTNQPAPSNINYVTYQAQNKKEEEINWVIFIILMIVFWPAGLIYLLIKETSKKK
ncbi:MAG TPA: hypothetical protein VIK96_01210 [Bacilli bacterium]